MKAQLQVDGRLYDAHVGYRPTDSGGLLALDTVLTPPYPPPGEHVLTIYLDGYRVNTVTVEVPKTRSFDDVCLRQLIELSFNAVPLPDEAT